MARRPAHLAAPAALLSLAPGAASAHAFSTGRDAYGRFLEGAGTVLGGPGLLLPVLALALMVALWREEGLLDAWPLALAGSLAGLAAAPFVGPWVGFSALGIGIVIAVLAALAPLGRLSAAIPWLGALVLFAVLASALEGHPFAEVTLATRIGALFGAHFALAAFAGLVRVVRDAFRYPWVTILWRVIASWIAAILVLYFAFAFTLTA